MFPRFSPAGLSRIYSSFSEETFHEKRNSNSPLLAAESKSVLPSSVSTILGRYILCVYLDRWFVLSSYA